MRLPDLAGYRLEELIEEDPFGWSFLAGNHGPGKRLVRIYKAQATYEPLLAGVYRRIAELPSDRHVVPAEVFSRSELHTPCAVSLQFPGWQTSRGAWRLSSLAYLSQMLDRENAITTIHRLAESLAELHSNGLFHGSLRLSNIFLTGQGEEPELRLAGFGEMVIPAVQLVEAAELPFFLAPEQLRSARFDYAEVGAWDVYAFGVIAYRLLTGRVPRLGQLHEQFTHRPDQLGRLPLVSMAEMTNHAAQILGLLEAERTISWPEPPADGREAAIRTTVEGCLGLLPSNRFSTMVEVRGFLLETVQHNRQAAVAASQAPPPRAEPAPEPVPQTAPEPVIPPAHPREEAPAAPSWNAVEEPDIPEAEEFEPEPEPTGESIDSVADDDTGEDERVETVEEALPVRNPPGRESLGELVDLPRPFLILGGALILGCLVFAASTGFLLFEVGKARQSKDQVLSKLADEVAAKENKFRQEMAKREKSSEALKADLDEVEDTKARLVSEAKLARSLLRQSQENGDRFFRLVLENGDTDVPAFRQGRREALDQGKKHYELLIETYGEAPDFMVSTAHAYYYLGRIYKELGDYGSAVSAFAEAEQRYLELTKNIGNKPEFTRNLAVAKQAIGDLAMDNGRYTTASQIFDSSSRHWQELRQLDPSTEVEVAIEINRNSLRIIECHHVLGSDQVAMEGAETIAEQFLALQEDFPENERVVAGLGASFQLLGRIYEAAADSDRALRSYQQAGALFAQAVKLNAAVDEYHLSLGNCLARVGLLRSDLDKLKNSTKILAGVVGRNPNEPEYLITLAEVYGYLAENQRNGGNSSNAIQLEEESIALLKPIIEQTSIPLPAMRHAYAKRLIHLAELRMDADKFDESRPPLGEAIKLLAEITEGNRDRSEFRRSLATARGLAGFASLRSEDRNSARELYELAQADWKSYVEENPDDSDAANRLRWVSDQLRALR